MSAFDCKRKPFSNEAAKGNDSLCKKLIKISEEKLNSMKITWKFRKDASVNSMVFGFNLIRIGFMWRTVSCTYTYTLYTLHTCTVYILRVSLDLMCAEQRVYPNIVRFSGRSFNASVISFLKLIRKASVSTINTSSSKTNKQIRLHYIRLECKSAQINAVDVAKRVSDASFFLWLAIESETAEVTEEEENECNTQRIKFVIFGFTSKTHEKHLDFKQIVLFWHINESMKKTFVFFLFLCDTYLWENFTVNGVKPHFNFDKKFFQKKAQINKNITAQVCKITTLLPCVCSIMP